MMTILMTTPTTVKTLNGMIYDKIRVKKFRLSICDSFFEYYLDE